LPVWGVGKDFIGERGVARVERDVQDALLSLGLALGPEWMCRVNQRRRDNQFLIWAALDFFTRVNFVGAESPGALLFAYGRVAHGFRFETARGVTESI